MRGVLRGLLAWIIGAVVAVGVGMFALSRIGYGFTVQNVQPLGSGSAGAPLGTPSVSAPALVSPSPSPTGLKPTGKRRAYGGSLSPSPTSPTPSVVSRERAFISPGGSVIVRCTRNVAYLVSWSPEQGYRVDEEVRRGPAAQVAVKFDGHSRMVLLRAWCADDSPQAQAEIVPKHDD